MNTVGTEMYILCPEGPAPEDNVEVRGVYISQKDTSAAAAATTGIPVGAPGSDVPGVVGADPDVGRVIAVSATRIHCLPAVVTAKERRFGVEDDTRTYGWRPGKSTFLERLEAIQIAKGERKPRGEEEEEESSEEESVEAEGTAFQQRMDGAGSIEGDVESEEDEYEYQGENQNKNQDMGGGGGGGGGKGQVEGKGKGNGEREGEGEGVHDNNQETMQEIERPTTNREVESEEQRLEKEGYFAMGWEGGKGNPEGADTGNAAEGPSPLPAR